jgi:predicted PurR-regulated permease PerM
VGFVIAGIFLAIGFGAISEIALPVVFAAVLAVMFKPFAMWLERHRCKPGFAASLVVLGLLILVAGVAIATVKGVIEQTDEISAKTTSALQTVGQQTDALGINQASLEAARAAVEKAESMIATGVLSGLVTGIGTLVALAGGLIFGSLVMYYLLKDGTNLRRSMVGQVAARHRAEVNDFIGDACRILRNYGRGRTVMSVIVSIVIGLTAWLLGLPLLFTIVVVNFIGGYIPYVGAFLGGGLAVIVALGEGGLDKALIMLAVVLAANIVLENFIEPKIMGQTLDVHPLIVLIVTALGGLVGGIVGLILAVPVYVIARNAMRRLRSKGFVGRVSDRARPAVKRLL